MAGILKLHNSSEHIKFKTRATANKWNWGYMIFKCAGNAQKSEEPPKQKTSLLYVSTLQNSQTRKTKKSTMNEISITCNGTIILSLYNTPATGGDTTVHGLYSPWESPGQNSRVGSLSFSRGSSQPRDPTQVSHIAGRFFTGWATMEIKKSVTDPDVKEMCKPTTTLLLQKLHHTQALWLILSKSLYSLNFPFLNKIVTPSSLSYHTTVRYSKYGC